MTLLEQQIRAMVDAMPPGSSITLPVDWVRCQLELEPAENKIAGDLTVSDVARELGRKPNTVRDWVRSGQLRGYLFRGREYRVTRAALNDFIEAQRQKSGPAPGRSSEKVADLGSWRRFRRGESGTGSKKGVLK